MNARLSSLKTKKKEKEQKKNVSFEKWKFIIYPLIAVFALFSFSAVFFVVLPLVNQIGMMAFAYDQSAIINYFLLPFMCIDMCIVIGYWKFLKTISTKLCSYVRGCFELRKETANE